MSPLTGVLGSFARSWRTVRGYWWRVFGTYLLVVLIWIAFNIVLGLILLVLPVFARNFVSSIVSGTLVAPFLALVVTLIYYRLTAAHAGEPAMAGPYPSGPAPAGPAATPGSTAPYPTDPGSTPGSTTTPYPAGPGPRTTPGPATPGPGPATPGPGPATPGPGPATPGPGPATPGPGPGTPPPPGPGTPPAPPDPSTP